jgi:hypothetical protein
VPRRLVAAIVAGALLATLSGCATPLPLPLPPGPGAAGGAGAEPASPLVAPAIGDCLDGMNDIDSDWRSGVACSEPHLYDVVAIGEWPGMAAALADSTPSRVYAAIYGGADDEFVGEYWLWAHHFCETAVRDALGWADLDSRFDALHVMPAGDWAFDMSLATRADFSAGEHRTLCSVGWFDEHTGTGASLPEDFVADTGPATEECWVVESTATPVACAAAHTDQTVLWFDARSAFGDGFLAPESQLDDTDWQLVYATCADLIASVLPELPEELGVWAWVRYPELWDELSTGGPEPETWYTMECLVGSYDGERFAGDLLDGAQPALVGGGSGSGMSA